MPVIEPQPGPQSRWLASSADIAIYGGAAGSGKTFAMLLEPLRHALTNQGFSANIFRRTSVQIRNPGGLWDESMRLYTPIPGAKPLQQPLEWLFHKGGKIKFAGLEHDTSVKEWQGSQIPLIGFDELTHFSASQFWYLLSRNRSMCGVRPYVRATCNPDADSWVAELIAWWIDDATGFPIPGRAGVIRYFVRVSDKLYWGDDAAELAVQHPGSIPKSLTFVPAKLSDNQALMQADPGYLANLMALPSVERARLLDGNWKVRPAAGLYFNRQWVRFIDAEPADMRQCRGWDLAATPKTETNDPDWTCGTRIGVATDKRVVICDHKFMRGTPDAVTKMVRGAAQSDGHDCIVSVPQDPAQAGVWQASFYVKELAGYRTDFSVESRSSLGPADTENKKSAKVGRFGPFSSYAERGFVDVVRGDWNDRWLSMLEAFPDANHDDDADSTARAFNTLLGGTYDSSMNWV